MLLLIYTNKYRVLKYDFESNCSWISKIPIPTTKLIGEVKTFEEQSYELISISTLISPYHAVNRSSECSEYFDNCNYIANYNYLKFVPKKIMKFCIADWKKCSADWKKCSSYLPGRIGFLEENLDKIYDELVIKDIIE
jgi:hypothetical protein